MSKQIPMWLGAALFFAGTVHAAAPAPAAAPESGGMVQEEASAPTESAAPGEPVQYNGAEESGQALSPDAKPVYLNGGHFGGQ